MTRLLVTGGAGFIGSNFVRRSLEIHPNMSITVLDALTYAGNLDNLQDVSKKIEFIHGDIRDREMVRDQVSRHEIVVHFAAESHNDRSLRDPEAFISTNVRGTFELINAAREFQKRFHHVSTDEVFGDLPKKSSGKFTADSPYRPSSPYSASKAASDHLVRAWVRSFGLRATISNCSNNYGPYQHPEKLIPSTVRSLLSGEKPKVYGDGKNVRDWIYVDDHTDGIWSILERGSLGETYLLGSNSERTNLQVVEGILRIIGEPLDQIQFVEDRPGHDERYALDTNETFQSIGWRASGLSFEDRLPAVVDFYRSKYLGQT